MLATGSCPERLYQVPSEALALDECGRRPGDAGADPADEITLDPHTDGLGADLP